MLYFKKLTILYLQNSYKIYFFCNSLLFPRSLKCFKVSILFRHTMSDVKLNLKREPKGGTIGRISVEYKVVNLEKEIVNDVVPISGGVIFENGQEIAVSLKK